MVLDNTYLSRAARSHVIEAAGGYGIRSRCIWLDAPLAQAQVNLVERLLDCFGSLRRRGTADAGKARAGLLAPTSQMRAFRELEPPSTDEGFTGVEHVPIGAFPRSSRPAGVFVAAGALRRVRLGSGRS